MENDHAAISDPPRDETPPGRLAPKYLAFLETIQDLRPNLHRYCARMTGSVLDGEDVVQEVLVHAYDKLDTFDDTRPLQPWLFRIAYNRCVDFLRQRGTREKAETEAAIVEPAFTPPVEPIGLVLVQAVEHLVLSLPAKKRACVLLKDVFDCSLEEIADLVDSTVGGVKAALHRGREKLSRRPVGTLSSRPQTSDEARVLRLYIDLFNRRDWIGTRELIAAHARLLVVDRFVGPLASSPYFATYERIETPWRLAVGELDGEPVVLVQHPAASGWAPKLAVRLRISDGKIEEIVDYSLCPWIVPATPSLWLDERVGLS